MDQSLKGRHFITTQEWTKDELDTVIDIALDLKRRRALGESHALLRDKVLAMLFVGGMIPFLFSSMAISAVGKAAMDMVKEVRRQFKEIPGLMEGTGTADFRRCVDISYEQPWMGLCRWFPRWMNSAIPPRSSGKFKSRPPCPASWPESINVS